MIPKKRIFHFKKWFSLGVAFFALFTLCFGIKSILNSPLFLIQIVEIVNLPQNPPVNSETLRELAGVPLGKASLFRLKLKEVEGRLLKHPWIKAVQLEKRFPQTVLISVQFRTPQALFQYSNGTLSYIDTHGKVYGKLNLSIQPDLPLISGFPQESSNRIQEALELLKKWNQSELSSLTQITSLKFDAERGYQALVTYPLLDSRPSLNILRGNRKTARTFVHLGTDFNTEEFNHQLSRLKQVFAYLANRGLETQQVWADTGKKVIVKIAPGS